MKPFISMGIVNVVNVCLSIWFVYGLGWGVKGLAAGTVIGWAAGAAFILWILRPRGHTREMLAAGDKEMAKKAVRFCLVVAIFAMGGTGLLISYFNTEFLSLFGMSGTQQSEVAAPVIRFVGLLQALTATMIVTKMAMRGAGATRLVTVYSFGSMWFIRVGVLWAAVHWFEVDLLGIWKIMMLDVLVQALVFMWLYLKGDWLKTEV